MLPGTSTSELLVIAAIALIVVGPKDLPLVLRKFGQFIGRMRSMAADFRSSFDDMARQSELEELRREVEAMRASTSESVQLTNSEISQAVSFDQDPAYGATFNFDGHFDQPDEVPPEAAPEAAEPAAKPKRTRKKAAATIEQTAVEAPVAIETPAKKRRRKTVGDAVS